LFLTESILLVIQMRKYLLMDDIEVHISSHTCALDLCEIFSATRLSCFQSL
jgi:hypothetical protein